MDKLVNDYLEQWRKFRSTKFGFVGIFFSKLRVTANTMTFISLIFGILAVYFLFQNYYFFVLFALLHLLVDGLDGTIARATTETNFGKYFDHAVDSLVVFLILIKIGFVFSDYYPFLVVGLFFMAQLAYFSSKLTAPIMMTRTISLILLLLYIPELLTFTEFIPVLVYLLAGMTSLFSLARQLQWWMQKS